MADMGSAEGNAKGYAYPGKVVTAGWVADHLSDPTVRIVESDEDILLYSRGHVPGAVNIDWVADLNDPVQRDYLGRQSFERLMSRHGIANDTLVVFYGDKNNWWACYALWVFELFGHSQSAVMDGGRLAWEQEGRPYSKEVPEYPASHYRAPERADYKIRAFRDDVVKHIQAGYPLVDVRSAGEYNGDLFHMEGYPQEGSLRTGHIKGAVNVPWAKAANAQDGTFKAAGELRDLYETQQGLAPSDNVIAYCRIGERSSHTWFVLKYLLGYPNVRNYDGSWTEWGNLVGAPIEKVTHDSLERQAKIDFILGHYENPYRYGPLEKPDVVQRGGNPGCGDVVTFYLKVNMAGQVTDISFEGEGCTISQAGASLATQLFEGKSLAEVTNTPSEVVLDLLGREIAGTRLNCALLGVNTARAAARRLQVEVQPLGEEANE